MNRRLARALSFPPLLLLLLLFVAGALGLASCKNDSARSSPESTRATTSEPTASPTPSARSVSPVGATSAPRLGGARPVRIVRGPGAVAPDARVPLVIVLHGYGGAAGDGDAYFELGGWAEREHFVMLAPDGTRDSGGNRFWNAVDGCCDFERKNVDDVAYLVGLIDEVAKTYPLDEKRVYVVGLSNGGAMAMRLACDAADRIAAIISVAGPFYDDPDKCRPKSPVSIRQVHGTGDRVVPYAGGPPPRDIHPMAANIHFPAANDVALGWVKRNGCSPHPHVDQPIDYDSAVPGDETIVSHFGECKAPGVDVELWQLRGSAHVPRPIRFGESNFNFLRAHKKP